MKIKSKQITEIEKNNKKGKTSPGLPGPGEKPAQLAGQPGPSPPPLSSSSSCQEDEGRVVAAREHTPATSCFPARRWRHPTTPRTPRTLSLSPVLSSPLPRFLAHGRALPSPPATVAAATASPSPSLCARELRHDVLYVLDEPGTRGRTVSSPPPSSSSLATQIAAVKFVAVRTSPNSPSSPSCSL